MKMWRVSAFTEEKATKKMLITKSGTAEAVLNSVDVNDKLKALKITSYIK